MNQTFIKRVAAVLAAVAVSVVSFAQVTTSSMNGLVTDETGEPLTGAAVVAVHVESGTQYYAIVNASGRYNISGMRAGGPYTVEISCLGYQKAVFTDITLQLAEAYTLNAKLSDDAQLLNEAVVVSTASSKFPTEQKGAATNISNRQIRELPTVSRSISDVTRLSPYGGNGMTFAGVDGRTANFTVDGANFNNNFGLSSNLPGGGNPISIDAIDEVQVVISPFDVRQTDFIGGGVNAITKSGTNTVKGSAYIYHRNENLRGDTVDGDQLSSARNKDRSTTYGLTLGGPIVKNKLFFFVNAEYIFIPTVVNRWRGSEDGVADPENYVSRTKLSDLQTVKDFVSEKYGYDTGSYTDFPANETNVKFLARIDWNINDANHLALRYNYTKNNVWNNTPASSMDGGTRSAYGRVSQYSMSFANSMYSMQNLVQSLSVDLNSRITDNLSNQLIATYSKLDDVRGSNSDEFPFIDILDGDGENYMALGYELFTWNNAVHNTVANVKDNLTYNFGSHSITAGLSYEYQMADNQYMRNGTGYYRYNSLDDFLNGATPEVVCLTYGYDGEQKPAARVQFHKAGLYAQDDWAVNENFKLTYGVRFDGLFFDNDDLITNNAIKDLTFYPKSHNFEETHIDTGRWPKSRLAPSPRVGFSWDVLGDKSLKLRGGSGFFLGRIPLVFFTNMPTNGGLVQYQAQINARNAADMGFSMDEFAGGLVTDASGKANISALYDKLISLGYPSTVSPESGSVPSSISAVDPNFKLPQIWKTSLAVDYSFPTPFPLSITAEGIFNKKINDVCISDWSTLDARSFVRFNGADDRPIYPTISHQAQVVDGKTLYTKAFVLENTNRGYGWSGSVSLKASPVKALDLMVAYTHTVSKEVTGMPGSAAESAFTYVPTTAGPNYIKLHNSQYVTPDRIVASLTHNDDRGNHYSFIYETWRGGYNYSYMLTNDMNGDGYKYDALYIPTDAQVANNEFRFASDDDRTRFMDYVHNSSYLSKHQGEYAEGYSLYSPFVHRLDFSYKHDFKVKVAGNTNTLQLSFDIKNLLNLFNSSWGVSKILNPAIGTDARILTYDGVDAEGYPVFSTPAAISGSTQTFTPYHVIGQCWYASVGLKYMFN